MFIYNVVKINTLLCNILKKIKLPFCVKDLFMYSFLILVLCLSGYQAELMTTLSHLLTLNGVDRHGSHIVMSDRLTDVPGICSFLV